MSVEGDITFWSLLQLVLVLASVVNFIFTLIVVRQVRLMTETLITQVAPGLKAISAVYSLLALGVVVLFVWLLF